MKASRAELSQLSAAEDAARRDAIRSLGQEDLYFYTRYMFKRMRGYAWVQNWHHKIICDALMRVFRGECKRLIINVCPRYAKTELAVVNFISWCFGKVPDCEFIHVSYGAALAQNNSSNVQRVMLHEAYADIFDTKLSSTAQAHWKTTAGGVMYATGAGGAITGFGAGKARAGFSGAIVVDDIHKPDEAASDTIRQGVIEWYQNTLSSRTNNPDTPIIVIMQRLHEEDLAGWLLGGGNGEQWEHICLPAIYQDDAGNDAALWEWKHSLDKLREMERSAPYVFAGQYMQRPAPLGGGIFKDSWWRYYNRAAAPPFRRIVQSWDTAFKTGQENDYSVCTTWGETETGYYLLDLWKSKVEAPDLRRMVKLLAAKYRPHALLIEDKASGQSLIQDLRRETQLPVIGITPDRDKVARANLVTPLIESGRVYLPDDHPEIPAFIVSAGQFPNGKHDDDIDSVTQALNYMSRGNNMQTVKLGGI